MWIFGNLVFNSVTQKMEIHYFGTGQRSIYRKQVGDFVTKKVIQNLFLEWVKRDGSKPHS